MKERIRNEREREKEETQKNIHDKNIGGYTLRYEENNAERHEEEKTAYYMYT
jgi:hypothetical protein